MLNISAIYLINERRLIEMERHIVAHNSHGCLTDPRVNDDHIHI